MGHSSSLQIESVGERPGRLLARRSGQPCQQLDAKVIGNASSGRLRWLLMYLLYSFWTRIQASLASSRVTMSLVLCDVQDRKVAAGSWSNLSQPEMLIGDRQVMLASHGLAVAQPITNNMRSETIL